MMTRIPPGSSCGGPNWESTTLAPACAARPKASVDIPSWRLATTERR